MANLPRHLEDVRIKNLPRSAFYIADFISIDEEQLILRKILAAPKPRWKHLSHRRLQTWPSDLTRDTLLEAPLPDWLIDPVATRLLSLPLTANGTANIFSGSPHQSPNHVLINEYQPGQGIMPHKDGSAYYPVVCTVSLSATLSLDIYDSKDDGTRETKPQWRILQEPRSLLVTTDELYTNYLHGIADTTHDVNLSNSTIANWSLLRDAEQFKNGSHERKTRVSLTYRDVLKVSKLGSKFTGLGRR